MSTRTFITERLARRSSRRPRLTLAVWLALAVVSGLAYAVWGDLLVTTDDFLTRPESKQVERLVAQRLPGNAADTEVVVVSAPEAEAGGATKALRRRVAELVADIEAIDGGHVAGVRSAAGGEGAKALLSEDGRSALILVTLAGAASHADAHIAPLYELVREADGADGYSVAVTGAATWGLEAQKLAESDLRRGELIGVPMALVILLIVFGAVAAALVPIVLAVVAIAVASALTVAMGAWFDVSVFAMNIVTVMGLAVGIDYSLLIVSRFREERRAGRDIGGAVARAGATASRAVLFSGGIVVLALTGMLIVPFSIFTSLGRRFHLRRRGRGRRRADIASRHPPPARRQGGLGTAPAQAGPQHGRGRAGRLLDARRARHDAPSPHRPHRRVRRAPAAHRPSPRHEDRYDRAPGVP